MVDGELLDAEPLVGGVVVDAEEDELPDLWLDLPGRVFAAAALKTPVNTTVPAAIQRVVRPTRSMLSSRISCAFRCLIQILRGRAARLFLSVRHLC